MASPWTTGSLGSLAPSFPITAPSAPQGAVIPPPPETWQQPSRAIPQLSQQPPLNNYGYQPRQTFLSTPQPFDESAQPQAPVANQQPDPSGWPGPSEYADPPTVLPEILPTANDLLSALSTIPRFLYVLLLLFLPFFYRARVHQIYYGVSLTEHEIASRYIGGPPTGIWRPRYWDQVKRSWGDFIDASIKEWNTLNIVSVLLLGAIYNVLQLGGAGSQLVQCTALMSLISALMSLIFGCLYVIRFETMRRPHKAMQWAPDALSTRNPWWNIFVLLALPFVWLAWSLILFLICLMATIWQTSGHTTAVRGLSPLSLPVKVIVSVFFSIGVFYLFLILSTFSHYGDIDEEWNKRIKELIKTPTATNRPYDQTYAWGANPYPAVPEQPPVSYAPYPTVVQIPAPPPPPFIGPYPIPYPIPPAQSPGGQPQQHQYTSRSVTPVSLSHITPFIPARPLSPTTSYQAPPYDNRYLSPHLSTHSPESVNRRLYSIAEGEGQEPSSPSFHRGRGPPSIPSQPQRQFSNDTRSSSDSHDISRRNQAQGIRLMPMAFPPDNTTTITIEPPPQPSSDSADNLDILERDEIPRLHPHHPWTDQTQLDDLPPPPSSSTTLLPPPTRLTTSLSPPPTYNDIPSTSLGFPAEPSPGGSRRSSRRPTPSPHRTDRHDPRTTTQTQDRTHRSSDRRRPPDLPPPSSSSSSSTADIMTRSISLPIALERHAGHELGGPNAPITTTSTAATATATTATATATAETQTQPPDAPVTHHQPGTPHSPLISPIPLPPHVSPLPPTGPNVNLPNLSIVDADADNDNDNDDDDDDDSGGIHPTSHPNSTANLNANVHKDDDAELESLELYSITPSRRGGAGAGAGAGAGGSGSGSEGVSLHTARGHFDSGSGSSDEEYE